VNASLTRGLRSLRTVAFVGFLILAGAWITNSWLLPRHLSQGRGFAMPLLEGSSRDEVYATCKHLGLVVAERPPEFDTSLPSGYLLRQIPAAGTLVKAGRQVTAIFSAGPRMVVVPALRGQTERQARLSLEDLGLVPGDLLRSPGDEPAGRVLSTRPGPGTRVPVGEKVHLLLSEGQDGPAYLVPDLRGKELTVCLALLEGSGLPAPTVLYRAQKGPAGRVLEQSPPAGSRLERGRTLELVVSSQAR
jgi:serine/threonine-protein kinase